MKEKLLVLGISRSKGIAKKTGKDYDILKLYSIKKAEGWGAEGTAQGSQGDEFNLSNDAYQKLFEQNLRFPQECNLTFGLNGSKQVFVTLVEKV